MPGLTWAGPPSASPIEVGALGMQTQSVRNDVFADLLVGGLKNVENDALSSSFF